MKRSELFCFINSIGDKPLYIDQVPHSLQDDFHSFMFGKTVGKSENGYYAYTVDVNDWKKKIVQQGLDTDVVVEK